jgi:hypothetical protein
LLLPVGCKEPCAHTETLKVDPGVTPFANGETVFQQCGSCPEVPAELSAEDAGPATTCRLYFTDSRKTAGITCFYGPGGRSSSSIANGATTDAPNLFGYCEQHCPDQDALHGCDFVADASGVSSFSCHYGTSCD